jgi:hypothetical protein
VLYQLPIVHLRALREAPLYTSPLYIPDAQELIPLVEKAKCAFGAHSPYIERAADLITQGHLEYAPKEGWICRSGSEPTHHYHVSRSSCRCPHFVSGGIVIQKRRFCKHKVALLIYEQALLDHLNTRLAGNTKFKHERIHAQAAPHARLLLVENSNVVATYLDHGQAPQEVCRIGYSRRGLIFATEREIHRFAHWLAHDARPLPISADDAAAQALALYTHLRAMGRDPEFAAYAADAVAGSELSFEEWRTRQQSRW